MRLLFFIEILYIIPKVYYTQADRKQKSVYYTPTADYTEGILYKSREIVYYTNGILYRRG